MKTSRAVRWTIGLIALALVGFSGISFAIAWGLTAPTHKPSGSVPAEYALPVALVSVPTADGISLVGWFARGTHPTRAIVLLHGNGSSRRQMLARASFFFGKGYTVLLYDARAHGESPGRFTSFGFHEKNDLLGALDLLRSKGYSEFGCVGASQGGATIAYAAPHLENVHWAVLEAVYPTIDIAVDRRVRRVSGLPGQPVAWLMMQMAAMRLDVKLTDLRPIETISSLRCPVLIMSGDQDLNTWTADTESLFSAARQPKALWRVPGAGHVDLFGYAPTEYASRLTTFLADSGW